MREGVVSRNMLDILAVLIDPESCDERLGKMNHGDTFKHLFPEQGSNKFGLFPPRLLFVCIGVTRHLTFSQTTNFRFYQIERVYRPQFQF